MKAEKYCVFGNPIAHSLSPEIHAQFAEQTGEKIEYTKQRVEVDGFAEAVTNFFNAGGKGLNVTVPFKQEAWALAARRSERAELSGAINTLWRNEKAEICGDNTDGAGLVSDIIERCHWKISNRKVLMLGAGGAARGVLLPLLKAQPELLVVANRTLEKAQELEKLFHAYGEIRSSAFTELTGQSFDLIINATSASLSGDLPPLPSEIIHSNTCAYDMVYAKAPTAFMQWCAQQGASQQCDGLGMLVGQAAESFRIWRGVLPEVEPVIKNLR